VRLQQLQRFRLLAAAVRKYCSASVDNTRVGTVSNCPANQPQAKKGLNNAESSDLGWSRCTLLSITSIKTPKSKEQKDSTTFLRTVYYRDAQHRAHWVTPPPEFKFQKRRRQYRDFKVITTVPQAAI